MPGLQAESNGFEDGDVARTAEVSHCRPVLLDRTHQEGGTLASAGLSILRDRSPVRDPVSLCLLKLVFQAA
jgi:hypothetical protein